MDFKHGDKVRVCNVKGQEDLDNCTYLYESKALQNFVVVETSWGMKHHYPKHKVKPIIPNWSKVTHIHPNETTIKPTETKVTGGPSDYYNFPFDTWVTGNDMMEFLAEHKWGKYGIHLKDIFKSCLRWGEKSGTTIEYDTKKVIYYGCRIMQMVVGRDNLRKYLQELLDDPQFKGK